MKAVTRSEHKRKELIICVLQHIRNLKTVARVRRSIFESRAFASPSATVWRNICVTLLSVST